MKHAKQPPTFAGGGAASFSAFFFRQLSSLSCRPMLTKAAGSAELHQDSHYKGDQHLQVGSQDRTPGVYASCADPQALLGQAGDRSGTASKKLPLRKASRWFFDSQCCKEDIQQSRESWQRANKLLPAV